MDSAGRAILAIVGSVMTLAIISVVLSSKAQTAQVISSATQGLGSLISTAEAPVTGGGSSAGGASSALGTFNSFLSAFDQGSGGILGDLVAGGF